MKKVVLIIGILFYSIMAQSQQKGNISIEGDLNYYYLFYGGNTKDMFNYGFSFLISNSFKRIKVSSGIDYSTKFYYYNVTPEESNNYLNKRENKLHYINFPFLVYIGNDFNKRFNVSAVGGLILNKLIKFDLNSYFSNKAPVYELKDTHANIGLTFRLGADISKKISDRVFLNITPFGDYKFILTKNDNRGIPDNKISLGIKIGIEYLFGNKSLSN